MNATAKKAAPAATKKPAPAAKTSVKPDAKPKVNIGSVASNALLAGKSKEQALEEVLKKFPDAETMISSISWYVNKLRKEGHDVKAAGSRIGRPATGKKALPPSKVAKPAPNKLPSVATAKEKAKNMVTKQMVKDRNKVANAPKPAAKEAEDGGFD